MFEKHFHTLRSLANELNIEESTIRDWQDQYESWIPFAGHGKNRRYPEMAMEVLRTIANSIKANMSPSEVEKQLIDQYQMVNGKENDTKLNLDEIGQYPGMNDNITTVFQNLLESFAGLQKRIADAQERRAAAEEKKAGALEKRAEAEKMKADAFNNLAKAIQGREIGSNIIKNHEEPGTTQNLDILSMIEDADISRKEDPFISPESTGTENESDSSEMAFELSDLSEMIEEPLSDETSALTDLSDLVEADSTDIYESSVPDDLSDLSDLVEEKITETATDLSDLIEISDADSNNDLSNLAELIDEPTASSEQKLSDLSELLGELEKKEPSDLTDLSDLAETAELTEIAEHTEKPENDPPMELSDLSDLTEDSPTEDSPDLINLSSIVDEFEAKPTPESSISEDLNEPTEQTPAQESVEPVEQVKTTQKSPKSNKMPQKPPLSQSEYKKKMMALIINMKENEGLTIDESVERLNDAGYKTISGADSWDDKTMKKIYGYIESVRTKKK